MGSGGLGCVLKGGHFQDLFWGRAAFTHAHPFCYLLRSSYIDTALRLRWGGWEGTIFNFLHLRFLIWPFYFSSSSRDPSASSLESRRSCHGSYVTRVRSRLCPNPIVPISHCSVNDWVRQRRPPLLAVWRGFLSRWLHNLFFSVTPWCILGFFFLFWYHQRLCTLSACACLCLKLLMDVIRSRNVFKCFLLSVPYMVIFKLNISFHFLIPSLFVAVNHNM